MDEDPIAASVDETIRGCFGTLLLFGIFVGSLAFICTLAVSFVV
jgi:hypothetical protein